MHDELVLYEPAAITLYLAERHPDAGLAPPAGTDQRAQFYKWMFHLTNTPQAEYRAWFHPPQHVLDPLAAETVRAAAAVRLDRMFHAIAEQLGDGPWLLGDRFSAADLFLPMLVRSGRAMPLPPRRLPRLARHAERVLARPAVRATLAAEGIDEPFI